MRFEAIAKGVYLEGLCVDEDSVWIADPIEGGVRRLRDDGTVQEWLPEKRWIGSLLLKAKDVILVSGMGGLIWLDGATGETGVFLDTIDGQPISGINEMVADRQGSIYFGTIDLGSIARGEPPGPSALYRLGADSGVVKLLDGLKFSNGLGVSPDGKTLYHNETFAGVSAYDIAPDGSLGAPRFLLEKPDCDGMAIDVEGTVWITGYKSGVIIGLRPDGSLKAQVELPAGGATNIRLGGADGRDLYVNTVPGDAGDKLAVGIVPTTKESVLYRGRAETPGLAVSRPGLVQGG